MISFSMVLSTESSSSRVAALSICMRTGRKLGILLNRGEAARWRRMCNMPRYSSMRSTLSRICRRSRANLSATDSRATVPVRSSEVIAGDTRLLEGFDKTLRGGYVAVTDYGYFEARIGFDARNGIPVGTAGIHLRARTPVDGQGSYAAVLQLLGKVGDYDVVAVPTEACLYGDGDFYGIDDGACDFEHLWYVSQHARAGTLPCHFIYRASEIYVEYVGTGSLDDFGSFDHGAYFAPIYLYCRGPFAGRDVQFAGCGGDVAYQCIGRYKLGICHVGPLLFANQAERCVCDILHRSKHHRALTEVYCAYLHVGMDFFGNRLQR